MQDSKEFKIGELRKAKSKLEEQGLNDLAAKIELEIIKLSEKKNDSAEPEEQSDRLTVANTSEQPQSSQPSRKSEDSENSHVLENAIGNSDNLGGSKWIGLAHYSKFKTIEAYDRYKKFYNRLRHKLRNWVKGSRKRGGAAKMKDILEDAKEIERLILNDALSEFREELLNIEYTMTVKGNIYAFGIDPSVLKSFFRD